MNLFLPSTETPASETISEGDVVVGKQHSSAEPDATGQVSKKKKRKTGADGGDVGEDKSLSGKKRQKKQAVKENAKRSLPLPSSTSPIPSTPGSTSPSHRKRSKSQEDNSQHKKPKLSSKKLSGPGKSPKSGKSPNSGKSPKSLGSGKPGKSPKSGKKGEKRR